MKGTRKKRGKMPGETKLKFYTTEVSVDKTVAEIEKIMVKHGATDVWKVYEGDSVSAINFIIKTDKGKLPFQLPLRAEAIKQLIINEKNKGRATGISWKKAKDINHARKVGWRIIRTWLEVQMNLIEMNMVKLEELFLPYLYYPDKGQTLYESIEEKGYIENMGLPYAENMRE